MSAGPVVPVYQKRKQVLHADRVIYEWEQELDEVNMFIEAPPGLPATGITCSIKPTHVTIGIKGNPPYIDEDLGGLVVEKESFWTYEDGIIHLQLQKALVGTTWICCTTGHPLLQHQQQQTDETTNNNSSTSATSMASSSLSVLEQQQEHEQMLLQRFQREHPEFDFSSAHVSGNVPDAREFMGGIPTTR